jgi:hypothetical protein
VSTSGTACLEDCADRRVVGRTRRIRHACHPTQYSQYPTVPKAVPHSTHSTRSAHESVRRGDWASGRCNAPASRERASSSSVLQSDLSLSVSVEYLRVPPTYLVEHRTDYVRVGYSTNHDIHRQYAVRHRQHYRREDAGNEGYSNSVALRRHQRDGSCRRRIRKLPNPHFDSGNFQVRKPPNPISIPETSEF